MSCFVVSPKNVVSLARKSLKYFSDFRNNTGIDMEEIFGIEEEDSENIVKGNELVNMAGRWNVGIEVSIIKPYTYSQSPKCVKGKMFCVYNSWDSRDISINFYEWDYNFII